MKVSYIIMPFENAEYLIRCVNSLYRQIGEDYEVILAENALDESSLEFLTEKPQVKRISETPHIAEEKLSEAFSLLADDSAYVQLLDVNTVISPIMAKAVLECDISDLIVPAAAIKKGSEFSVDMPELAALKMNYNKYAPQRFCFKRGLFERFIDEVVENAEPFSLFLISAFAENYTVNFIDDVCIYAEQFTPPFYNDEDIETASALCTAFFNILPQIANTEVQLKVIRDCFSKMSKLLTDADFETVKKYCDELWNRLPYIDNVEGQIIIIGECLSKTSKLLTDADFETVKKYCDELWNRLSYIDNVEGQIKIIGDYITNLSGFLTDKNLDIRQNAFYSLQNICEKIRDNYLFKKYFEGKISFSAEDFLQLSYDEYAAYKQYVPGAKNPVSSVDITAQNKLLKDMKTALDSTKKELSDLKRSMSDIKTKPMVITVPQGGGALKNPAADIPQMYRDGRLGLKTIGKSFNGWLKYKLSRKNK